MATKTINLTGAEVAVTGLDGAHAHIRNDSTEVIYAAKTAGITAGADGVASIPAGQSDTIRGISGAVYLLGTGSVLIQSDDYVASPFKTSAASGGSAVDEVARTAINTHAGNDEIHVTAEEKAAWNAVNYSNPNLLINPDFRINQRGQTEYPNAGAGKTFTVDRWHMSSGNMKVSLNDAGNLVVSRTASGGYPMFGQTIEQKLRAGEFYTYSTRYKSSSGLFKVGLVFMNSSGVGTSSNINRTDWLLTDGEWHTVSITAEVPEDYTGGIYVYVHDLAGTAGTVDDAVEFDYFKIENGGVATPFCPPDPATELAKCQRYYQIRSTGDIIEVDLRPTMRDTPTITQLSDGNYAYSAEL